MWHTMQAGDAGRSCDIPCRQVMWHTMQAGHVTYHAGRSRDVPWTTTLISHAGRSCDIPCRQVMWRTMQAGHVTYHAGRSCDVPWTLAALSNRGGSGGSFLGGLRLGLWSLSSTSTIHEIYCHSIGRLSSGRGSCSGRGSHWKLCWLLQLFNCVWGRGRGGDEYSAVTWQTGTCIIHRYYYCICFACDLVPTHTSHN